MLSHTVGQTVRLSEKSLHKVETYSYTGKNERHSKPDFASNGQFAFCLQVIAKSNGEEDDCYCDEHDSERWGAMHGCFDAPVITYFFTSTQGSVFAEILAPALQKEAGPDSIWQALLQQQTAGAGSHS